MTMAVPYPHGWTPESESSLIWWLDAADLTTITKDGSDLVSAWSNKAATGFGNMTSSGAERPTWLATGISSSPAVSFNLKAMTGTFTHTGSETISLFIGTLHTGHSAQSGIIYSFAANTKASNQPGGWVMRQNGAQSGIEGLYNINVYCEHNASGFNTPFMITGERSPTIITNYLNGGNPLGSAQTVTTDFDLCSIGCFILFTGETQAPTAVFRIGEILTFASGSTALREKAEGYLAWRWGVTLATGHAWKQRAP